MNESVSSQIGNILVFPKQNKRLNEQPAPPEMEKDILDRKTKYVNSLFDTITNQVFKLMGTLGVNPEKPSFKEDAAFAFEALRATIYRNFELQHPFHPMIDNATKQMKDNQNGNSS
jgi:hypothetical protein